jgi:hypothetical protein
VVLEPSLALFEAGLPALEPFLFFGRRRGRAGRLAISGGFRRRFGRLGEWFKFDRDRLIDRFPIVDCAVGRSQGKPVISNTEGDAEGQGALLIGASAIDPDEAGRPDRLVMPGTPASSEDTLNFTQFGLRESDLAMSPSADPDRSMRQLEHSRRRVSATLDLQERRFRHRVTISYVWFDEFRPRDPGFEHDRGLEVRVLVGS